ncbi:MAG: hypothetical protein DRQ98_11525 [Gammaproteobacteria bacterium]|nr:MAG: hypothetical protein DRQ98_11525 [Gammaproteobacteria bacterium]
MVVTQLLNNEQKGGFTHKVVLTHADLTETTANTAQTIEILTVELGSRVSEASYILKTDFEDASDVNLNATVLEVGDDTDPNRYIVSKELNTNGTEIQAWSTANDVNTVPYTYLTADTIDAVIGSMAAKSLSDIDTGEVWIYLNVVHLGR